MDIDWKSSSYAKGHEGDPAYDWIRNSTVKYVFPSFDGPFGELLEK